MGAFAVGGIACVDQNEIRKRYAKANLIEYHDKKQREKRKVFYTSVSLASCMEDSNVEYMKTAKEIYSTLRRLHNSPEDVSELIFRMDTDSNFTCEAGISMYTQAYMNKLKNKEMSIEEGIQIISEVRDGTAYNPLLANA